MSLPLIHRRLAVLMSLASLLAFAGGAGVEPLSATLAGIGLLLALIWQPSPGLSARLEKFWIPLALLLMARVVVYLFRDGADLVVPVVDLLFLLLVAESLRSLNARNDIRLYSLSFALLLASTAYRPGILFLLAFVVYVVLGTQALMVGFLRRESHRHGCGNIPVPRSFLLLSLGSSTMILAVAALVFLSFPRVSRGWSGRGDTMASSMAGFSDEVTLGSHGGRIYGNPQVVLRVEFPDGAPENRQDLYWRGRSYDRFDGFRWSRSDRLPPAQPPPSWYRRWSSGTLHQRVYGAPLRSRVLFAVHPLLEAQGESGIQPVTNNAGDHLYWGFGPPGYSAYSVAGRPTPQDLREAQGGFFPARSFYTQLPSLSPQVLRLADSLLGGMETDYDRALRLIQWFQDEFTYTLELPRTVGESTIDHFLLRRRAGHCEYFSTAMAVLLRTQGILAREVNGFLGGTWSELGGYLVVSQNDAHAWVEVWFPEFGWVPFDPTPPGRAMGRTGTSWFWPGRFFLDAIQHRWNKWILDYSFQTQFQLLATGSEALAGSSAADPSAGAGRRLPLSLVGWVGGGVILLLWAIWLSRDTRGLPRASRIFLDLKDACRQAGVPDQALRTPGSLTGYLETSGHPAAPPATRLVGDYLRVRFSGLSMKEEEEIQLRNTLKEIRKLLKQPAVR